MKVLAQILGLCRGFLGAPVQGETIFTSDLRPQGYEWTLLTRALAFSSVKADPDQIVYIDGLLTDSRRLALLTTGQLDVAAMVLTPVREKALLPVRIDLTRGVQGYRLFLIRTQDQKRFNEVKTLEALRSGFSAGFGAQWGDLSALQAARLPVVTAADASKLFIMLQGHRFDYFPRGVNEIWDNLAAHQTEAPDMTVETGLALYYPLVQCFEVAPGNARLADRIRQGLEAMLADGTMKRIFLQFHQASIQRAKLSTRTVFEIPNPELPLGGPGVDRTWWLGRP